MVNESLKNFYEKYWSKPEQSPPSNDPTRPQTLKLLLSTLKKISAQKILDAGCGTGYFCGELKKLNYDVTGVDISEKAILVAKQNHPEVDFFSFPLDGCWLFSDAEFDVILCIEVIEHILGIYEMFSEICRVLKPGGYLILTTPYHGLIKNLAIVLFNFDNHFNNVNGGHIHFFTNKFLKKILYKFGMKVVDIKYIGRCWPFAKSVYIVAKKIK